MSGLDPVLAHAPVLSSCFVLSRWFTWKWSHGRRQRMELQMELLILCASPCQSQLGGPDMKAPFVPLAAKHRGCPWGPRVLDLNPRSAQSHGLLLFNVLFERQCGRDGDTQGSSLYPLLYAPDGHSGQEWEGLGLCQPKTRSMNFHPGLPCAWKRPRYLDHLHWQGAG